MFTKIRMAAAFLASLAFAFVPTAAQAVDDPTTVAVTVGGAAPTAMAQGDQLDVVTRGPIAQIGSSIHTLSTAWSAQSLHLKGTGKYNADTNPDGITVPQGWSLQYSTDGTTWLDDAPSDISTIVAVRSRGNVKTKGRGKFETTTVGEEVATSTGFTGSSGGDGFNVAFLPGVVLNSWHHDWSLNVECHLIAGGNCGTYVKTISGYETAKAANLYTNQTTGMVYEFVRKSATGEIGVYCLDYSDILNGNVAACSTPFTSLATGPTGGVYFENRGSTTARTGDKIFSIDVRQGDLLCFDVSTGAACTGGLNGFSIGSAGNVSDGNFKARVSAANNKVFFTVNDTFGCFDIATVSLCGNPDSTPEALTVADSSNYARFQPIVMYNTDGSLRGACDPVSLTCIDGDGAATTAPSGFAAWLPNQLENPEVAGVGYSDWAISGTKLFRSGAVNPTNIYPGWPTTIKCWDYATDAPCTDWNDSPEGVYQPYTTNIDPNNPECVWVNQDRNWSPGDGRPAIKLIPINARTGVTGCSFGDPVIELPYSSVVPRMTCTGDGRVTAWTDMLLELGSISNTDVSVSFLNSSGAAITGWQDLTPGADGVIDMSTLSVDDTGLTPSIRITGLNSVTIDDLLAVSGVVTFDADEPEMCLALIAETNCPDATMNNPSVPDVPAGIVEGASVTTPLAAGSDVGSNERLTVAGTNTGALCAASIVGDATATPELASTGFDSGGLALGGFGALAAGIGAVAISRRRRA